jgi:hypothetical protein
MSNIYRKVLASVSHLMHFAWCAPALQAVAQFLSTLPTNFWLTVELRLLNCPDAPVLMAAFRKDEQQQQGRGVLDMFGKLTAVTHSCLQEVGVQGPGSGSCSSVWCLCLLPQA